MAFGDATEPTLQPWPYSLPPEGYRPLEMSAMPTDVLDMADMYQQLEAMQAVNRLTGLPIPPNIPATMPRSLYLAGIGGWSPEQLAASFTPQLQYRPMTRSFFPLAPPMAPQNR